jgi:hypothetical protein
MPEVIQGVWAGELRKIQVYRQDRVSLWTQGNYDRNAAASAALTDARVRIITDFRRRQIQAHVWIRFSVVSGHRVAVDAGARRPAHDGARVVPCGMMQPPEEPTPGEEHIGRFEDASRHV